MGSKDVYDWEKELNDLARPLGCRVVYKWWSFHLYKKDTDTGIEYYVNGLESINDIKNYLNELQNKKEG